MRLPVHRGFLGILLAALLGATAPAQKPAVKYDPAAETKFSGVIEEVKEFHCPVSGTLGYHLVVRSSEQLTVVHVAASKFLRDYEITFAKGEQVEVTGSKVRLDGGEEGILARQIKRGQNTYTFRDKDGRPLW